jgi:hypothetical protein
MQTINYFRFSTQQLQVRLANFRSGIIYQSPHTLTYQKAVYLLATGDYLERFLSRYCVDYVPAQWHYRPIKIDKRRIKELFATASWALFTQESDVCKGIPRKSDADLSQSSDSDAGNVEITSSKCDGMIKITSISYIHTCIR